MRRPRRGSQPKRPAKAAPGDRARRLEREGDRLLERGKAASALKKYRVVERRMPERTAIYGKLIRAHRQATTRWGAMDLVASLGWEMRRQALRNPALRAVHARLKYPMKRIGLTGGIGTGKTTVAQLMAAAGFPVVDADAIAHDLLAPGTPVTRAVVRAFGDTVRARNGAVDRQRLGAIVFADAAKRRALEAILHPAVRAEMERQAETHAGRGVSHCLLDIPLLFESAYDWQLDAVIVVSCDAATQLRRCREKFGWSAEEAGLRIRAQWPMAEKAKRATFVIDNNGPIEATRAQVLAVVKQLGGRGGPTQQCPT